LVEPFREGLAQFGYVEGRNLLIEFRWAEGHYDRLTELAADLVRRQVAVIAAFSPPAVQAAKAATATIPIVFESGNDPIKAGLVASFNRPGGNATGINILVEELLGKRLGLLHELVPTALIIAAILTQTPAYETQSRDLRAAAEKLGIEIRILNASTEQDVDKAFTEAAQMRAGALLVGSDPFLATCVEQMVALAARYSVPTIYARHEFVKTGGLMSYDVDFPGAYRQSGIYVGLKRPRQDGKHDDGCRCRVRRRMLFQELLQHQNAQLSPLTSISLAPISTLTTSQHGWGPSLRVGRAIRRLSHFSSGALVSFP
jgi:putative ABC transport system substrate-binding protein